MIKAELGLDRSDFSRGIGEVKQELNAFASGQLSTVKTALAQAFTVGAITKLASDAIALGGKFDDLGKATGIPAEQLQRLDYVAKQHGTTVEQLAEGLKKLAVARQQALADPGGQAAAAFKDLGVSLQDLRALSPEQLFYRIANAVRDHNAAVDNAASMQAVLGRGFNALVPVMAAGGDELQRIAAEADRLGIVLSSSTIKALDEMGDRLDATKMRATSFFATWIAGVAGVGAMLGAASANRKGFMDFLAGNVTPEAGAFSDAIGVGMSGTDRKTGTGGAGAGKGEDSSSAKAIERSQQKAADMQRRLALDKLTSEDRLLALEKERQALVAGQGAALVAGDMETYYGNLVKVLEIDRERLNLNRQIEAERNKDAAALAREAARQAKDAQELAAIQRGDGIRVDRPIVDSLQRIGGFVGGQVDPNTSILQRQLLIQEKTAEYLRKIAERNAGPDEGLGVSGAY